MLKVNKPCRFCEKMPGVPVTVFEGGKEVDWYYICVDCSREQMKRELEK